MYYDQTSFAIRCEWGLNGLRAVASGRDTIVIVDVLSFTTCVDIATARGAVVFPYQWKDASAVEFAAKHDAVLAGSRRDKGVPYSLSPKSLATIEPGRRVVLPSPNGAMLSLAAATTGAPVVAACLRNARAVSEYVNKHKGSVAIVAAGEKWKDKTLRPSLEDWLGVGAVISRLYGARSPESQSAVDLFLAARAELVSRLSNCASGRELTEFGFADDVELASMLDVSEAVPILQDGAFVADV